jgi:hypothetical protein
MRGGRRRLGPRRLVLEMERVAADGMKIPGVSRVHGLSKRGGADRAGRRIER